MAIGQRTKKTQLKTITITKGPRKGQRILAYVRPNGKWTEVRKGGRGATSQRRAAAKKGGLKDRFGRTAAQRGKIRLKKGLSASGRTVENEKKFISSLKTSRPVAGPGRKTKTSTTSFKGLPKTKGKGKINQTRPVATAGAPQRKSSRTVQRTNAQVRKPRRTTRRKSSSRKK